MLDPKKVVRTHELLLTHRQSHHYSHWQQHPFTVTTVRDGQTYCICESCCAEMAEIVSQWERDYDSTVNALYEAHKRFLGFDPIIRFLEATR
jgi:hypothetical protein